MKKLASLILALAMCFALGAPAFAGETSQSGNLSSELTSLLPNLTLTLPETAQIILNPYRNTVDASVATNAVGIDKGDKLQVMNGVFSVVSNTASKVYVKAVVSASTGGSTEFATAAIAPGASGHKLHLTFTHTLATGKTATVPVPDNVDMTKATNMKTISDSETTIEWTIPAAGSADTAAERIDMQFGGTCSDSPTEEDGPWTEGDTVSASIVFTASVVTDDPMVTMMYQATDTTPTYKELVINTTKPTDYKDTPTIVTIKSAAAGSTLAAVTDDNKNTASGSTWDGSKITLPAAVIGSYLGVTATGSTPKVVEVTLSYANKAGGTSTLVYTAKVHVLAAPAPAAAPASP